MEVGEVDVLLASIINKILINSLNELGNIDSSVGFTRDPKGVAL